MENLSDFIKQFEDHYFWDVEVSELDPEASKRLIIKRVFKRGQFERYASRYFELWSE